MLSLNFTKRNAGENKDGMLKAIYYSGKTKAENIFVDAIEFQKVYREAGESAVVSLVGDSKLDVMIHDVQYDAVKNVPVHVDFYVVEKGAMIHANVPLNFVGISEGVKTHGGNLVKVIHELSIEADAAHLPHEIDVDISVLSNLDSVIHVRDIKLPQGVKIYHVQEDDIVASIAVAVEEDLSTPVSVDLSSIKVEEKGKKEESAE